MLYASEVLQRSVLHAIVPRVIGSPWISQSIIFLRLSGHREAVVQRAENSSFEDEWLNMSERQYVTRQVPPGGTPRIERERLADNQGQGASGKINSKGR